MLIELILAGKAKLSMASCINIISNTTMLLEFGQNNGFLIFSNPIKINLLNVKQVHKVTPWLNLSSNTLKVAPLHF